MTNNAYKIPVQQNDAGVRVVSVNSNIKRKSSEDLKFLAALGAFAIVIFCLLVYTVNANKILTETKAKITDSTEELTRTVSENVYLDYKIETMLSVENIEDYATEELNLVKFSGAQIDYVDLECTNKIEVIDDGFSLKEVLTKLTDRIAD